MKKYKDPTKRDILKALSTINHGFDTTRWWCCYNDKRGEDRRRIKLPVALSHSDHDHLQTALSKMFPAHTFAIGHHLWRTHWFVGQPLRKVTVIHVFRDNGLYNELFPEIKEFTLKEIADMAGIPVECLRIKK